MRKDKFTQDGIDVSVVYINESDAEVTPEEVRAYIDRFREKRANGEIPPATRLTELKLEVDKEDIDISYEYVTESFERIRRITGYLVGSLDRFNDAKRAEVADRVSHGMGSPAPKKKSGMEIGD